MNQNLLGYLLFAIIMAYIIIKVGYKCYKNGIVFIDTLIPDDPKFGLQINRLLHVGYYLTNIGYTVFSLSQWENIATTTELIEVLSIKSGIIIIGLSVLHYINIISLTIVLKNRTIKI